MQRILYLLWFSCDIFDYGYVHESMALNMTKIIIVEFINSNYKNV